MCVTNQKEQGFIKRKRNVPMDHILTLPQNQGRTEVHSMLLSSQNACKSAVVCPIAQYHSSRIETSQATRTARSIWKWEFNVTECANGIVKCKLYTATYCEYLLVKTDADQLHASNFGGPQKTAESFKSSSSSSEAAVEFFLATSMCCYRHPTLRNGDEHIPTVWRLNTILRNKAQMWLRNAYHCVAQASDNNLSKTHFGKLVGDNTAQLVVDHNNVVQIKPT